MPGAWATQLWGCRGQPQSGPGVGSRLLVPEWAVMGMLQAMLGWEPCQGNTARVGGTNQHHVLPVPPAGPSARTHPLLGVCLCILLHVMCAYACLTRRCTRVYIHAHAYTCMRTRVYMRVCARACPHEGQGAHGCAHGWGELC